MAKQNPYDPSGFAPGRYTETRLPQFIGGEIDEATGNLRKGTPSDTASGKPKPTAGSSDLTPLQRVTNEDGTTSIESPRSPSTRLSSIDPNTIQAPAPITPVTPPRSNGGAGTAQVLGQLANGLAPLGKELFKFTKDITSGPSSPPPSAPVQSSSFDFSLPSVDSYFDADDYFGAVQGPSSVPLPPSRPSDAGGAGTFDDSYFEPETYAPSAPSRGDSGPKASDFSSPGDSGAAGGYSDFSYGGPSGSYGGTYTASFGGSRGGTVICTELHRQGRLDGITFQADQAFGAWTAANHPQVYAGYISWARPTVWLMQRSKWFSRFVQFVATPWAQYLAVQVGERKTAPRIGALLFHGGWHLCALIGAALAIVNRVNRVASL
ncbi:MAG: hypothetical protein AB7F39_06550 [Variibacter sp.]